MIEQHSSCLTGWARFSDCQRMRYRLSRSFSPTRHANEKRVVFCMLNPSTADAFVLDPTVRRCMGFARAWGADVLEVVNLFALRSTDPEGLYEPGVYIGDGVENDESIMEACQGASLVVAAWGKHGEHRQRGEYVRAYLAAAGIELRRLKLNKDGSPAHPLYLKSELKPETWT